MCKKSCKCKGCCKNWKDCICIPVWAVIITGSILGTLLVLFYLFSTCRHFWNPGTDFYTFLLFTLATSSIYFVVLFGFVFIILIKIPAACCGCSWFKNIWLVIHIIFLAGVALLIFKHQVEPDDEFLNYLNSTNTIFETEDTLTDWFIAFQNDENCCGLNGASDYGNSTNSQSLTQTCPEPTPSEDELENDSTVPGNNTAVNATEGCLPKLLEAYYSCNGYLYVFTCIMLVLGVVPFVCYTIVYKKALKQRAKQDEESDDEDGESDKEESNEFQNRETDDSAKTPFSPKSSSLNNN